MSGNTMMRTPRNNSGDTGQKRSTTVAVGVLGASLLGGYGLMNTSSWGCKSPPAPGTPEALAMDANELAKMQQEYEQCRRRRTASSSSRSGRRSFFSSSGSSRSSISRGGFGRSGSFGG